MFSSSSKKKRKRKWQNEEKEEWGEKERNSAETRCIALNVTRRKKGK